MRNFLIAAAVVFQFAVLAYMAAERELIAVTGRIIQLRTAPIDPNNPFMGTYVRLNYEISSIPQSKFKGTAKVEDITEGTKVFTVLKDDGAGNSIVDYCTDRRPKDGLYIKGYATRDWRPSGGLNVKYGIEAFFVQQEKGLEIEKRAGSRNEIQTPLIMEVALSKSGTAVLKGRKWNPVGIGIKVIERPAQRDFANPNKIPEGRRSAKISVTLMNASDKPLAIVDLPDHASFIVENTAWTKIKKQPSHVPEATVPTDASVIVLKPEEKWSFDIDFADKRWFFTAGKGPTEIGLVNENNPWGEQYRIFYSPPDKEKCSRLKDKDLIWHGRLPSQAFNPAGWID